MFRTLFAATAMTLAVAAFTPALAGDTAMPRTISLTGHGEVRMAPDLAIVSIGVLSQSLAAKDALAQNTTAMQAIFAALKQSGIDDKDVQTSNFMIQPRYEYHGDGKAPTLSGYDVSNAVTVTIRKLDTLGTVLDLVVQSGSNQINGIHFSVSKPDTALDEARKLAVADAKRKAEVYTAAGGVTLGNILSMGEGGGYQPPAPMVQAKMLRAEGMADAVPIAQGEQVLSVDVNIVWEIK